MELYLPENDITLLIDRCKIVFVYVRYRKERNCVYFVLSSCMNIRKCDCLIALYFRAPCALTNKLAEKCWQGFVYDRVCLRGERLSFSASFLVHKFLCDQHECIVNTSVATENKRWITNYCERCDLITRLHTLGTRHCFLIALGWKSGSAVLSKDLFWEGELCLYLGKQILNIVATRVWCRVVIVQCMNHTWKWQNHFSFLIFWKCLSCLSLCSDGGGRL